MNRKTAIVFSLILLGIAIGVLCVFFSAPKRLSDEEIERLRAEYHVVDKWPLFSEISDHADYASDLLRPLSELCEGGLLLEVLYEKDCSFFCNYYLSYFLCLW